MSSWAGCALAHHFNLDDKRLMILNNRVLTTINAIDADFLKDEDLCGFSKNVQNFVCPLLKPAVQVQR